MDISFTTFAYFLFILIRVVEEDAGGGGCEDKGGPVRADRVMCVCNGCGHLCYRQVCEACTMSIFI